MKSLLFLLLLILSACTVSGQAEINTEVPGMLTEATSQPLPQPTVDPAFAFGVLLSTWGEGKEPYKIRLVDPATGQNVAGFVPIALAPMNLSAYALSPDGKKLAMVETHGQVCEAYSGGTTCRGNADILHLVDIPGRLKVIANLPKKGWVDLLAFSPNATHLALVQNTATSSTLMVLDTDTGKLLGQRVLQFRPTLLTYTQDGVNLVVYGQPLGSLPGISEPGPLRVLLVEATSLEAQWDQQLEDIVSGYWCLENCTASLEQWLSVYWEPAVIPSQDGRQLYILHADEDRLTTVDFDTRTVRSTEIRSAQSWFERFLAFTAGVAKAKGGYSGVTKKAAISPDGKQFYVVVGTTNPLRGADGNWESVESQLELQVIDVKRSQLVASREIHISGTWIMADKVSFTPDGAFLILNGWSDGGRWAEVLEAKSLKQVADLEGWELVLTRRVGGQPIILGDKWQGGKLVEFTLIDPRTFEVGETWKAESTYSAWLSH